MEEIKRLLEDALLKLSIEKGKEQRDEANQIKVELQEQKDSLITALMDLIDSNGSPEAVAKADKLLVEVGAYE